MKLNCPKCNIPVDEQQSFCTNCGFPLKKRENENPQKFKYKSFIIITIAIIVSIILGCVSYRISPYNVCKNDLKVVFRDKTISLGDTKEEIKAKLGNPDYKSPDKTHTDWSIPKLTIGFVDNRATSIFFISKGVTTFRGVGNNYILDKDLINNFDKVYQSKKFYGELVKESSSTSYYIFSHNKEIYIISAGMSKTMTYINIGKAQDRNGKFNDFGDDEFCYE